MDRAFDAVRRLVTDFKAQESAYLAPGYQESQVRQDFIDKFFTALGWDGSEDRIKATSRAICHFEERRDEKSHPGSDKISRFRLRAASADESLEMTMLVWVRFLPR